MNASVLPRFFPGLPDDATAAPAKGADSASFARALGGAFDSASSSLDRASAAEGAYAAGHGDLQTMVVARAQADVALQIATVTASRTSQALSTILGMQI